MSTKKKKSATREWIDALVFAVVAASLIRWLFLEPFTIPTASMEKSLLVGDFLFVSKMHYGTRVPKTILQVPLTHQKVWGTDIPSYSDAIQLPYMRLPGFSDIERNDVVVFNYPVEFQYPNDLKTNYIKRAVAVPGDVLEIREGELIINDEPGLVPEEMQYSYDVVTNRSLNNDFFKDYGIDQGSYMAFSNGAGYLVWATDQVINRLKSSPVVVSVTKRVMPAGNSEKGIYPEVGEYGWNDWNRDNYGPLMIPGEGMSIEMNEENVIKYSFTIEKYEGHDQVEVRDGALFIDGQQVDNYTFKQNYYFMMGDNRHDSLDSRYWGFVPEDHVVGKAWFLWLSLDQYESMFNKIRWSRFFKGIE
ncbi:signal peptidase I [Algoriphagus hitonicola]|uniref:Signal peptidase I n=1 Tax=Algoriphagus hitonicola TaxID=435880 RepID=A0A1I2NE82_9BACT|nr:signal peptidase I [Algoriphagus hitonicola]SFG01858.1 signal peptidase I [Algoriphagus hitonicola]